MDLKRILLAGIMFVLLTGCGRKEIVYETYNVADNSEAATLDADSEEKNPLISTLGIDDSYKWKETIETNGKPIYIDAELELLYNSEPSTAKVEEKYYSDAEKREILEYFFEPDSILVDCDIYPTKELLRDKIEQYDMAMKDMQIWENYNLSQDEITMISKEKDRLADMINEAPDREDVSEEVRDYSENYYKGMKDGIAYSLGFDIDESRNQSAWTLQVKDYKEILTKKSDVITWQGEYYTEEKNQCTMTEEQAADYTKKVCEDLGFTGMEPCCDVQAVTWYLENGETECNGYYFEYTLDINGAVLMPAIWSYRVPQGGCIDVDTTVKPYDEASIEIVVNDFGIVWMDCTGIISKMETVPVKLLSYEQIKGCFRSILERQGESGEEWSVLSFCYIRISNQEKQDAYCYIPAWVLVNFTGENILINAIDGTQIDVKKDGYVLYDTPESWLKQYQNMMLSEGKGYLLD